MNHKPPDAAAYCIELKNQHGVIVRLPDAGSWRLLPLALPSGLMEGLLHIIYLDGNSSVLVPASAEQDLQIVFSFSIESEGKPADGQSLTLSTTEFAKELIGQDPDRQAEDAQVRQEIDHREQELLTVNTLQRFMRDTLSHIIKLQDATTKSSQIQMTAAMNNLSMLAEQSSKMLTAQFESAKLIQTRLSELQPAPATAPNIDIGATIVGVAPFLRDIITGFQKSGRSDTPIAPKPERLSPVGEGDLVDAESLFPADVSAAQIQDAAALVSDLTDIKQMARILSDPDSFDGFVERFRKKTTHKGERKGRTDAPPAQKSAPSSAMGENTGKPSEGITRPPSRADPKRADSAQPAELMVRGDAPPGKFQPPPRGSPSIAGDAERRVRHD